MGLPDLEQRLASSQVDVKAVRGSWEMQDVHLAPEEPFSRSKEVPENPLRTAELATRNGLFHVPQGMDPKDGEEDRHQVGFQRDLSFEVHGDEYLDVGRCHWPAKSGLGTRGPPEEGSKPVNGREALWLPGQDRESTLKVVTSGSLFDVRAYKGERKPSRLYEEEEEELRYKLPSEDVAPKRAEDLEEERQEIIRSQVVRKMNTVVERWSSADELEAIGTASPSRTPSDGRRSYSTGFAVCFDTPSPGWVSTPVDPENIDTEQIDFAAARQQFLALEKRNPNVFLGPRRLAASPKPPAAKRGSEKQHQSLGVPEGPDRHSQRGLGGAGEGAERRVARREGPASYGRVMLGQISPGENAESDLRKTNVGPMGGRVSAEGPGELLEARAGGEVREASDETPIEREIRLSWEREEDLWKERGIQRLSSRDELVEIQSKPLLLSSSSPPPPARKGKDKLRVSFFVQREIEQETQREEDLRKEGRLLGAYDRGTRQELGERRKVFEQDDDDPLPSPGKPKKPGELGEEDTDGHPSFADGRERTTVQSSVNRSFEAYLSSSAPNSGQGRPGNEASLSGPSATAYSSRMEPAKNASLASAWEAAPPSPGQKLVLRKEHFAVPISRAKFCFSDEQVPPDARREGCRAERVVPREELYTLRTWKPRTSALIDQEIREALQRELELQEQRRRAGSASMGGDGDCPGERKVPSSRLSSQSSAASGTTGSYSVLDSPIFSPGSPVRSPASSSPDRTCSGRSASKMEQNSAQPHVDEEERRRRRRQREDGKYAGIEPTDEIDTEVVKSTRAIRRRGLRAQLWEAGQISRIGDDDNDSDG